MSADLLPADFLAFLLAAKHETTAGQGDAASILALLPGAHQLEYSAGAYLYRDIYVGTARFAGQEMVYHRDRAIWSMSYAGGVVPAQATPDAINRIYAFLRAALRQVMPERPFRGPALWKAGDFEYHDKGGGELAAFHGHETIRHAGQTVYTLRYGGGALR